MERRYRCESVIIIPWPWVVVALSPVMVETHAVCQVRWFACYRIKYEVRALTLAVGADAAIRILLRSAIRRRAAHVPHVAVFTVRVATLRREVWEWRAVVKAMKIVTPVYVQVIVLAVATCMRCDCIVWTTPSIRA